MGECSSNKLKAHSPSGLCRTPSLQHTRCHSFIPTEQSNYPRRKSSRDMKQSFQGESTTLSCEDQSRFSQQEQKKSLNKNGSRNRCCSKSVNNVNHLPDSLQPNQQDENWLENTLLQKSECCTKLVKSGYQQAEPIREKKTLSQCYRFTEGDHSCSSNRNQRKELTKQDSSKSKVVSNDSKGSGEEVPANHTLRVSNLDTLVIQPGSPTVIEVRSNKKSTSTQQPVSTEKEPESENEDSSCDCTKNYDDDTNNEMYENYMQPQCQNKNSYVSLDHDTFSLTNKGKKTEPQCSTNRPQSPKGMQPSSGCSNSGRMATRSCLHNSQQGNDSRMCSQSWQGSRVKETENTCSQSWQGSRAKETENTCSQSWHGSRAKETENTCSQSWQGSRAKETENTCSQSCQGSRVKETENTCSQSWQGPRVKETENTCSQSWQGSRAKETENCGCPNPSNCSPPSASTKVASEQNGENQDNESQCVKVSNLGSLIIQPGSSTFIKVQPTGSQNPKDQNSQATNEKQKSSDMPCENNVQNVEDNCEPTNMNQKSKSSSACRGSCDRNRRMCCMNENHGSQQSVGSGGGYQKQYNPPCQPQMAQQYSMPREIIRTERNSLNKAEAQKIANELQQKGACTQKSGPCGYGQRNSARSSRDPQPRRSSSPKMPPPQYMHKCQTSLHNSVPYRQSYTMQPQQVPQEYSPAPTQCNQRPCKPENMEPQPDYRQYQKCSPQCSKQHYQPSFERKCSHSMKQSHQYNQCPANDQYENEPNCCDHPMCSEQNPADGNWPDTYHGDCQNLQYGYNGNQQQQDYDKYCNDYYQASYPAAKKDYHDYNCDL